jgi:ATP-dependent DNA helicase RecG
LESGNLKKMGLNDRQIKAVMYVKKGKTTNKKYRILTGISRQMVTIELKELVNKNIIIRIGKAGKGID